MIFHVIDFKTKVIDTCWIACHPMIKVNQSIFWRISSKVQAMLDHRDEIKWALWRRCRV